MIRTLTFLGAAESEVPGWVRVECKDEATADRAEHDRPEARRTERGERRQQQRVAERVFGREVR